MHCQQMYMPIFVVTYIQYVYMYVLYMYIICMYVYMYVQEYATTYIMADRRMAQCMDNIIGNHTAKEREHSALPELSHN